MIEQRIRKIHKSENFKVNFKNGNIKTKGGEKKFAVKERTCNPNTQSLRTQQQNYLIKTSKVPT